MSSRRTPKQTFMQRAKIKSLSPKEKERRWLQHVDTMKDQQAVGMRGNRRLARKGYTRGTRLTRVGTTAALHLTPCAQNYFLALVAPFSEKMVACVPDMHAVPSKKIRVKTRGVFATGQDGNGFCVVCNWCNSSVDSAIGYSQAPLVTSTSVLSISPPAVGVGFSQQPKLPYNALAFQNSGSTPGVQARTVGVGLRIRYIGPELARSGQITGIRHPDNETLVGLSYDNIKSYSTAKVYGNKREWHYVMYRPVRPDEYHFSQDPATASDSTNFKWEMGFIINGTTKVDGTPGSASFEWETIRYVEYIGNIDNITKTHVDLVGMSHVRNSLPEKSTTAKPHSHLMKSIKSIEDSIGESLPAAAGGAMAYKNFMAPAAEAGAAEETGFLASAAAKASEFGAYVSEALPSAAEFAEGIATLAPALI